MAEHLDPKRPWITDPDDLPANNNLLQTLFNPTGRSSKVPFTRVWTWMFFLNLLLVPALVITLFVARPVGVILVCVYVLTMLIRFVVQTRRLADSTGVELKDLILYPNLIIAPATLIALFVPWPGIGSSWPFGLVMLGVHLGISAFAIIAAAFSDGRPRATFLAGLVLAPVLISGAMFAYQANKGVAVANGIMAMQKLGGSAAKMQANQRTSGGSTPRPRGGGASRPGTNNRRRRGGGGQRGGPPEDMKPMDMVIGMAITPTVTMWAVTSFGVMLWSLMWVAPRPRKRDETA